MTNAVEHSIFSMNLFHSFQIWTIQPCFWRSVGFLSNTGICRARNLSSSAYLVLLRHACGPIPAHAKAHFISRTLSGSELLHSNAVFFTFASNL